MKSALLATSLLIGLALVLSGCGQAPVEKVPPPKDSSKDIGAAVESQLSHLRQDLAQQQARNAELVDRIQSLMDKLAGKEKEVAQLLGTEHAKGSESETPGRRGPGDTNRIGLLGAKALAEHKAAQLSKRLDALTKDLQQKEQALDGIRRNAKQKEEQVQTLKKKIEELQSHNEARTAQLGEKMQELTQQLTESTSATEQFKQELKEKEELLSALKNAANDAARLKGAAEKEVESLAGKLADTMKQLQVARADADHQRQTVAQLSSQLDQVRQEAASLKEAVQKAERDIGQYSGEAEGFKQETEKLFTQLKQAREAAQRAQQEGEQFREEGENFRKEAVKLRVEVKRSEEELAKLKAHAQELIAKVQELESPLSVHEDSQQQSPLEKIMEVWRPAEAPQAAAETEADQIAPPKRQRQAPTARDRQAVGEELEEETYEAPTFEQAQPSRRREELQSGRKPKTPKDSGKVADGKPGGQESPAPVSDLY